MPNRKHPFFSILKQLLINLLPLLLLSKEKIKKNDFEVLRELDSREVLCTLECLIEAPSIRHSTVHKPSRGWNKRGEVRGRKFCKTQ